MKTITAERAFIANDFAVVYNATADKFSFVNKVVETTLSENDNVNDVFVHNIARTYFGQKEGNSTRVTKKANELHCKIEVEDIMTNEEHTMTQTVENDNTTEVEFTEVEAVETADEVVETDPEVAVTTKPFTGWGIAPKPDLINRIKETAIEAGADVTQIVSEADIADDDEPKVIHDRKPTDRETKFAIMDSVISSNPELNDTEALIVLAEMQYGGELYAEAGKKYWMNKRLEHAGRVPSRGGSRGKKEKTKAVKVPTCIQMLIDREVGEGAVVTNFDQDSLIVNAELNGQAYVVTLTVTVSAPEMIVDDSAE